MQMTEFTPQTRGRIRRFFNLNPDQDTAFPCGHDDICGYISTHDEATLRERTLAEPEARCPGCGSHIDESRYVKREVANA